MARGTKEELPVINQHTEGLMYFHIPVQFMAMCAFDLMFNQVTDMLIVYFPPETHWKANQLHIGR